MRRSLIGLLLLVLIVAVTLSLFFSQRKFHRAGDFRIINAHEHFQSITNVPKFLKAMKASGVVKTVILGSPEATIKVGRTGFFGEEKYNMEVIKIANTYPEHFIAFPTINVHDPDKLEKLRQYLKMGGQGLKLYSGHNFFHDLPLDDEGMAPVYEYCEANQIPILFHVNSGYFQQEFENVLKRFPKLKVICPHFCLATIALDRFEKLMDTYPDLYTDLSFGFIDFLKEGLHRISREPEKYRKVLIKYQDRIFFGTDMVVTSAKYKTWEWLAAVTRAYRDMLEKETYNFFALEHQTLRGLHLEKPVLDKIYRRNFEKFFYGNT